MSKIRTSNIYNWISIVFLSFFWTSCANIGTPNGGPYDEKPPVLLKSTPSPNQLNFKDKTIELFFDELVLVNKPSENVVITPPQIQMPEIKIYGKRIEVKLLDSLKANTTYTIDFTNALSDNNEKNVLENFSFAFSTGNTIDSLQVSGTLLNAENLEPMPGIIIGLHNNLNDSSFVKTPFFRTSRTNDKGQFTIRNIATGTYRIFALNDVNRDYKFDQPGEEIAFGDSTITPSFVFSSRQDTLWKDTLTIDTIKTIPYTHFLPDNVTLRLFKEEFIRQYLKKSERKEEQKINFYFNASLDTIPRLNPLNFTPKSEDWYFIQTSEEGKTISYWLTDTLLCKKDTLDITITYPKSDSLNILQPQTDTVSPVYRRKPVKKQKKSKKPIDNTIYLDIQCNHSGTLEMYDTIRFTFNEPILDFSKKNISFEQQKDTLWFPVKEYTLSPDSTNSLAFHILHKWEYNQAYRIKIDSASVYSVYNHWNKDYSVDFRVRKEDEYGHLYINIPDIKEGFVELLNRSDVPIRKEVINNGGVLFMDLKPDKYYARVIIDSNHNNKWDTGNYSSKTQPEDVYYCPRFFDIKKHWQVEETWDVMSTPITKQKPLDITKNKPKETTKKKRDYKNEGKSRNSNNQLGGKSSGGFSF